MPHGPAYFAQRAKHAHEPPKYTDVSVSVVSRCVVMISWHKVSTYVCIIAFCCVPEGFDPTAWMAKSQ